MPEVVIGLGANDVDPERHVKTAISGLEALADGPVEASSLWVSEPVAMNDDSGTFINAVAAFQTSLNADELLRRLQLMEETMGRPRNHDKNVARAIDLDILTYGGKQSTDKTLQLPHPRIAERLFVLLPLQEIRPEFVLAGDGRSLETLIAEAPPIEINRR